MHAATPPSRLVVEHLESIDSTNAEIFRRAPLVAAGADALWLVARHQTAGRGRMARRWVSTPQGSLTATLGLEASPPRRPASLSLAAGATIATTLAGFGADCRLKWPNDLYRRDRAGGWRKVGGILCELRSGASRARIAVGVGLNLLPDDLAAIGRVGIGDAAEVPDAVGAAGAVGARAVEPGALFDSAVHAPAFAPLADALGHALHEATRRFLDAGLAPFLDDWRRLDCLDGQSIAVHRADGGRLFGVARGIDDDGALLVESAGACGALIRIVSDEVSVRFGAGESRGDGDGATLAG